MGIIQKATFISIFLSFFISPGYAYIQDDNNVKKDKVFKVTLLGTGTPIPSPTAFGPSTLIEVAGQKLLFDAGRGAATRLIEIGAGPGGIDAVFITHMHSDHLVGLSDVLMTGWLPFPWGSRKENLPIYGPPGIQRFANGMALAFEDDIKIRTKELNLPLAGGSLAAHIFEEGGVVYAKDGVTVTAFSVSHGEHVRPSFGYRIDFDLRSVVISGDTTYSKNLIMNAQNVDLLIHEVFAANDDMMGTPIVKNIKLHHIMPREAGIVFKKTKPKIAVFNHIALLPPNPPTRQEILLRSQQEYTGKVVMGEDKMIFLIQPDKVVTIFPKN